MASVKHHYENDFKLKVLSEYLSSNESIYFFNKKYKLPNGTINRWKTDFLSSHKSLSLPDKVLAQIEIIRKKEQKKKASSQPKSREEELQEEVKRLREALEFSEMRNEALHEVLKIGREQYGIDLLKKAGARQ